MGRPIAPSPSSLVPPSPFEDAVSSPVTAFAERLSQFHGLRESFTRLTQQRLEPSPNPPAFDSPDLVRDAYRGLLFESIEIQHCLDVCRQAAQQFEAMRDEADGHILYLDCLISGEGPRAPGNNRPSRGFTYAQTVARAALNEPPVRQPVPHPLRVVGQGMVRGLGQGNAGNPRQTAAQIRAEHVRFFSPPPFADESLARSQSASDADASGSETD